MWKMIPTLLLAAVTLTTGVLLTRLGPLQPGPDPLAEHTASPKTQSECELLRNLFNSKSSWMFEPDNKEYNDYVNKYNGFDNEPYSFQLRTNQIYQPQDFFHEQNPHPDEEARYERPPPIIETVYLQNKDVVIRDNDHQAYYLYDTYIATTSPFDYVQDKHNCLYKAMERTSPHNTDSADSEKIQWQNEREELKTGEVLPSVERVLDKRFDNDNMGEKEIPDLAVNEEETSEVQKKLFSFWSRLQALSHKGRQLPTRGHTFAFYGPDGTRDGPLTAETRASHLRPAGQPLRWG